MCPGALQRFHLPVMSMASTRQCLTILEAGKAIGLDLACETSQQTKAKSNPANRPMRQHNSPHSNSKHSSTKQAKAPFACFASFAAFSLRFFVFFFRFFSSYLPFCIRLHGIQFDMNKRMYNLCQWALRVFVFFLLVSQVAVEKKTNSSHRKSKRTRTNSSTTGASFSLDCMSQHPQPSEALRSCILPQESLEGQFWLENFFRPDRRTLVRAS